MNAFTNIAQYGLELVITIKQATAAQIFHQIHTKMKITQQIHLLIAYAQMVNYCSVKGATQNVQKV